MPANAVLGREQFAQRWYVRHNVARQPSEAASEPNHHRAPVCAEPNEAIKGRMRASGWICRQQPKLFGGQQPVLCDEAEYSELSHGGSMVAHAS